MLKVRFEYDLPEYDPSKHDPDKVFGFLTYRGVHYAKWIDLKSRADKIWKIDREGWPSLFLSRHKLVGNNILCVTCMFWYHNIYIVVEFWGDQMKAKTSLIMVHLMEMCYAQLTDEKPTWWVEAFREYTWRPCDWKSKDQWLLRVPDWVRCSRTTCM